MSIRNLDYLFRPKSIAVIGATNRAHSVGATVMLNLISGGFAGRIMPVNPKYDSVSGLPTFHNLSALPVVPDMAIICTPPATIPDLISQLGSIGTKAAIVLTAGLGDTITNEKITVQQAMLDAARPHLLRILGPNCIGLIIPSLHLNASFASASLIPGKIAFVSQSGALATAVLDWASSNNIGFSKFISLGNSADVDFGDILDYLGSDPDTRSILLYIESIKFARKFMSAARAAARNKQVIVVKAGRSPAGAMAAASHTGAMAGSDLVFDAAIKRAGMLRVDTTQELFGAIETLSRAKPIHGDRLVILTNGGGPGVMAADALSLAGEHLTVMSNDTLRKLNAVLPSTWSKANPIDIIGDAPVERYKNALSVVLGDGSSDAVLFIHAPTAIVGSEAIARECMPLIAASDRNLFGCWLGGKGVSKAKEMFSAAGIPTYPTPEEAVKAFLQLITYRRNQELLLEVPESQPVEFSVNSQIVRDIVGKALKNQRSMLNEVEAKEVLAAYGIPVVETLVATTLESLSELAQQTGFPAVLKILSPDITHKSDVGGVAINLNSVKEVLAAAKQMTARLQRLTPPARLTGFTVQAMIIKPMAHELILGVANDGTFGPVILFGRGGTLTQLINDRAVSLPPLNEALAKQLVANTRIFKILEGYRDHPKADLPALYSILVKLSQLVIDIPEILELDINPLLLDEHGAIALDARVSIASSLLKGTERLAIRPYPKEIEEVLTLTYGKESTFLLRPIVPTDLKAYQLLLHSLSSKDVHNRFFCSVSELPQSEIARVTQIDYNREMTLVLTSCDDVGAESILGEIRLVFDPDNQKADMGIAISTEWQSKGFGSKLLSKAICYCRERGAARIVGTVLAENAEMLNLARKFGFQLSNRENDVISISLTLQ
ncbi:bifunctional acetate--CoA ligase family protein/GNAT family N-acetyltransferase [Advenella sp. FME57]|uniref:bifunctional acetate--CoA ligase family protein/GNAT family N-acetyltransferase n=1 Tax=Advenella sp. FME57 TaxID=2742604 RepID=UPI001865F1CA|nr:GNAT family N-acetyltransferase [Advenella sp. FME57]